MRERPRGRGSLAWGRDSRAALFAPDLVFVVRAPPTLQARELGVSVRHEAGLAMIAHVADSISTSRVRIAVIGSIARGSTAAATHRASLVSRPLRPPPPWLVYWLTQARRVVLLTGIVRTWTWSSVRRLAGTRPACALYPGRTRDLGFRIGLEIIRSFSRIRTEFPGPHPHPFFISMAAAVIGLYNTVRLPGRAWPRSEQPGLRKPPRGHGIPERLRHGPSSPP